MSIGAAIALSAIEGAGLAFLESVLGRGAPYRSIGGIIPQVTMEEQHVDDVEITRHPVAQGANISDHAINQPARLIMRVGWSLSGFNSAQATGIGSLLNTASIIPTFQDPGVLRDVYAKFLIMKENRQPINIITGKRAYTNMLVKTVLCSTDKTSENALLLTVAFEQIIVARIRAVDVPPASAQSLPGKTQPITDNGTKQLLPAPNFNSSGAQ